MPQAFARGLAALESTLRPEAPVTLNVWTGTPVEQLVERSLRVRSDGVSTVINVLTPPGMWRRSAPPELEALVASVPGASVTGASLVARRLRQMVWRDAVLAGLLGLVVVFGMLLWELKGPRAAALCLVPVAVGSIWMVGALAWLELPLNFLNVFVVTMVIGVGVDYGIHMLHRLREAADVTQLAETARSVVLAALTTIVGFGSLVLTHYPGLRSIGWMTCFGVLFSCVSAVVILPLLVPRRTGGE